MGCAACRAELDGDHHDTSPNPHVPSAPGVAARHTQRVHKAERIALASYARAMRKQSGGAGRRTGRMRFVRRVGRAAPNLVILLACSSKPPPDAAGGGAGTSDGAGGAGASSFLDGCPVGTFICEGDRALPCEDTDASRARDCSAEGATCRAPYGCVVCTPGEGSCEAGAARVCNAEGTAFIEYECDPAQGMACEADGCKGSCSIAELGSSYQGCDYYPTVTVNPVFSGFHFAVAVANTGSEVAHVVVTRGAATHAEVDVPARQLRMIPLPWVAELKGGDQDSCQRPPPLAGTLKVVDGAYRLRSNQPVSVYQFNPLEYELVPTPADCPLRNQCPGSPPRDEGCLSFSNDATLLFPSNVLTGSYGVLSWPSTAAGSGFISVVGTRPDTHVSLAGRGVFLPGAGVTEDGSGEVVLGRLDFWAADDA